ncbi:MAG: 3-oxoacyl-[acyl-carrier-protein] reductase [Acidimicrobiales bacterium]|jgi:2-hydroxycyclohexanecarboxyl-CoA dehydrogenase|nr:3-oxoacyl-[acyl-carrier-protein] reductase [Acidimicrobiales bacterium]
MSVEVDLEGKVALVTGAGAGIGAGAAHVLAAAGAHVVVAEIDADLAATTVDAIRVAGGRAEVSVVDVRRADDVNRLAATTLAEHGRVDILVNNVGHYLTVTPFGQSDDDHWDALDAINFRHVLRLTRAVLPSMVARGSGSVINVTSVEGLRGYPPDPVYGAYKAAVAHFTRCLALEVAPDGVRVNAIAPDLTHTVQVDYDKMTPPELADRWPIWAPIGRRGVPADNADVILFLASDLSRFMIGQVIPTDGGSVVAGGWFRTVNGRWTNRPRNP